MILRRYLRGVTLLELLIVIVVVGVLAAVAYPNYRDFTDRARRNEAKALLLEIAQNQERFYLQNNRYGDLIELGYGGPTVDSASGAYTAVVGPNPDFAVNFSAVANYNLGGNEAGKCQWFSIDGRGNRASGDGFGDCWTRTR